MCAVSGELIQSGTIAKVLSFQTKTTNWQESFNLQNSPIVLRPKFWTTVEYFDQIWLAYMYFNILS